MGLVYVSQIKKLKKRLLVEPALLWASSYTHLLYKAQDPFNYSDSPVGHHQRFLINLVQAIWMQDLSMFYRSRNSGRDFWWNQLPCGPVLTPISCTKLKILTAMQTVQLVLIRVFVILCRQFGCGTSLCFTDQETQETFGGTSSLVGQFLN